MPSAALLNRSLSATCGVLFVLTFTTPKLNAGPPGLDDAAPSQALQIDSIDSGLVWIDGRFVPPPYQIAVHNDSIIVNGIDWKPSRNELARLHRKMTGDSTNFEECEATITHAAERLVGWLATNSIIVAFSELPVVTVPRGTQEYHLCSALCAAEPSSEQMNRVIGMSRHNQVKARLHQWLSRPELSASLRAELESRTQQIDSTEVKSRNSAAAVRRLRQLSYPLTVAGMLLGVLGLGHMLKWSGLQAVQSEKPHECVRAAELALLLMLGMSTIDLVWTVLAGQAGSMTELNPLGSRFIQSPVTLATFKVLATGCGCGILYVWRHRQQIQQATWWMCLVCILLTFRWVVVDSLGV